MSRRIVGTPGATGVAIGPVWRYGSAETGATNAARSTGSAYGAAGHGDPVAATKEAAEEAARQLESLAEQVRDLGRAEEAGIFEAQALMATDPELLGDAVSRVESGTDPVTAMEAAAAAASAMLAALPDELLAARAADVRDVGARITRILMGLDVALPAVPSIAVADDLPPSIAAEIPPGLLLGLALEGGSITAHAVILARGLGIPAVVGARGLVAAAGSAASAAVDGAAGEIVLDPDASETAAFAARGLALENSRRAAAALRGRLCATADGERVTLLGNIGGPQDAARALEFGAEGVGLFRTEFLFMKRQTAPSEAEQVAAYRAVFEAFGPERPVEIGRAHV